MANDDVVDLIITTQEIDRFVAEGNIPLPELGDLKNDEFIRSEKDVSPGRYVPEIQRGGMFR